MCRLILLLLVLVIELRTNLNRLGDAMTKSEWENDELMTKRGFADVKPLTRQHRILHGTRHPRHFFDWEHTRPACGRCVSRRRTFLFVSLFVRNSCCRDNSTAPGTGALPRRSAHLRRDAVSQRVGMKSCVITQTKPGTIGLGRLRYGVFLTRGKILP